MELNEPVLADDYPMYGGCLYVVDGELYEAPSHGSVAQFKEILKATEIRRCDIVGRQEQMSKKGDDDGS